MRIDFVEIANFRKLLSTRVGFSSEKTIFVGANNSGKTSAMVALRTFLVGRERHNFTLTDLTLSHWTAINAMGKSWEEAREKGEPLPVCSEPRKLDRFWLEFSAVIPWVGRSGER
jgi:predicted ATP-dependent endonuclease of OLD family